MPSPKNLKMSCVWHAKLCTVIPQRQIFYICNLHLHTICNLLCSHFFPPGLRKQTKYRIEGISTYTGMVFGGYMIDQIHGPMTKRLQENSTKEQHKKATTSRLQPIKAWLRRIRYLHTDYIYICLLYRYIYIRMYTVYSIHCDSKISEKETNA